jgi:hypothetical protein
MTKTFTQKKIFVLGSFWTGSGPVLGWFGPGLGRLWLLFDRFGTDLGRFWAEVEDICPERRL